MSICSRDGHHLPRELFKASLVPHQQQQAGEAKARDRRILKLACRSSAFIHSQIQMPNRMVAVEEIYTTLVKRADKAR
eukprot:6648697-Prorocentrum_lima.AAC.1